LARKTIQGGEIVSQKEKTTSGWMPRINTS